MLYIIQNTFYYCNIEPAYLCQSVGSSIKLELAGAKKSELGWLGSQTNSLSQPGSAQARKQLNIQAELGSGSEGSGISELGSARARTKTRFEHGSCWGLTTKFSAETLMGPCWDLVGTLLGPC